MGATVSRWKMNWNQGLVSLPHTSLAWRVRRTMNSAGQGPVRVSSSSVHVWSLASLAKGRLSEKGTSQAVSTSSGQLGTTGACTSESATSCTALLERPTASVTVQITSSVSVHAPSLAKVSHVKSTDKSGPSVHRSSTCTSASQVAHGKTSPKAKLALSGT